MQAAIRSKQVAAACSCSRRDVPVIRNSRSACRAAAPEVEAVEKLNTGLGFKLMRDGVKEMAQETILTPRFYTTDFDEVERIFSKDINPNLNMEEICACLQEFRNDYNKKHFVRNQTFPEAANCITGATRKIFIEFLERSCTAEFSGFLLYKELARRLKDSAPEVAEIFLLLSRDEARHAGFINKGLSDFNLALDLGFMTKNRSYTFFKPKYIIYTTFLSEKIGYWRYITIYRHLQRNPDYQLYPLFEYFENWCQDENRHGDFLAAVLKAKPDLIQGWEAEMWSRFFCLSVYITMYLNDHQRTAFYESLGLNTRQFCQHVIIETNKSSERIFPVVPEVETEEFWHKMNKLVDINNKLIAIDSWNTPDFVKKVVKLPLLERLFVVMLQIFFITPRKTGSADIEPQLYPQY